jgi:hypothetical protein
LIVKHWLFQHFGFITQNFELHFFQGADLFLRDAFSRTAYEVIQMFSF